MTIGQAIETPDDLYTFSDEQRTKFGGDYAILKTVPKSGIHPETNRPIFGTRAEQVHTGTSTMSRSFLRGDIIYKAEPEAQFAIYPHHDDGTQDARDLLDMLYWEAGYRFCQADEWELSPRMRQFWIVENNEFVQTISAGPGVYPERWKVMYLEARKYEIWQRRLQQASDETMGSGLTEGQREATGGKSARTVIGDGEKQVQDIAMSLTPETVRMTIDEDAE